MKSYSKLTRFVAPAVLVALLGSCSDSFLSPEPMSFFEPEATFSTESGLQAALAIADRHLRRHMISENSNSIPMATELEFSEMAVCGKTDWGSGFQDNWAGNLTPTSWFQTNFNDGAMVGWFWSNGFDHVKYANTVLDYVDKVTTLDEDTRNEYKGRGYFHRAWAYYNLVFQYGDVPLVTCLPIGPKQDYRSCPKSEILKMMAENLKDAVRWVPSQKDMQYYGMVNKEACRLLLAKILLCTGDYKGAEEQCNELINNSGLALMRAPFGSFTEQQLTAAPETWTITRNVIWDLHRPENKILAANTETIMGMPNCSEESFQSHPSMRVLGPMAVGSNIKTPTDSKDAIIRNTKNDKNWRANTDWVRAAGRGIGIFRATYWSQHNLWTVNGVEDTQDLRHNHEVGNWLRMEDYTVSNVDSKDYGKNLQQAYPEDVYNKRGVLLHKKGDPLCTDTIRSWFDVPLYKMYYRSATDDKNPDSNDYQGASKESNANYYLYRLAEAYLVRAEARLYQNNVPGATSDVNELRKRANCSQLYSTVNIGDIMNERARELYMEEFRHVELVRVSMCLAMTGIQDEWGNTYDINTWDKQTGTDAAGGSYWYQRIYHYSLYNHGPIVSGGKEFNYTMDKHNMYWPVSHDAIVGNKFVKLHQNYGYDGYDESVPMWSTWQEADAAAHEM